MWMKVVYLRSRFGGLAHLARALAWQARGDLFESGILHEKKALQSEVLFVLKNFKKYLTAT